jgi:hypothetical protein
MQGTRWVVAALAAIGLLAVACGGKDRAATDERASMASSGSPAAMVAGADAVAGSDTANTAGAAPAQQTERKVVSTVSLDLTVKDVQASFERIGVIAEASGGLVADASVRQEGESRRASVTLRVPVARSQDVLGQIRGLATKVEAERTAANDVTEEYTDLQSRQRNLEATEQQLLTFMTQARNVQEVLQVQERLTTTRGEIEKARGRINLLSRLTDMATIQIQLRPEAPLAQEPPSTGLGAAFQRGWDASLNVLRGGAVALLTLAGFSWWLLPLLALGGWLVRREQRRRVAPTATGEQG